MCRQPIRIKNNAKYIANNVGHQFYIWVNCGKCDECIKAKQTEWNLRCYYQCMEVLKQGGYIYFDTLTYRNEDLPRLGKYIETNKNYPCFDYRHIREFYEKLRQQLKLKKDKEIKYFITTEYGDIRKRPHAHIMLFVYNKEIQPLTLSEYVSKAWKKGRTDGRPYKSKRYVLEHNIIKEMNLNAIRYIAKYVNKSQTFMQIVNKRWQNLEQYYNNHTKYNKLQIKRIKRQYYRLTTPFHRQSQNFGIEALNYFTKEMITDNPIIWYKNDTIQRSKKCRLPMYYYRKLFTKQIKYNGKRIWINNEDGIKYKQTQEENIIETTKDKLTAKAIMANIKLTEEEITKIAIYILFERGRLKGKPDYKAHHKEAELYNYNTDKDLLYLGKKGISKKFAGNDKEGYCTTEFEITDIEDEIYINNELEAIIEKININKDTTQLNLIKEHMAEIKKIFFK